MSGVQRPYADNSEHPVPGTNDFRPRLYGSYIRGRRQDLAPVSIDGLRPRAAYLNKVIHDHFPTNKDAAILDVGCGHGALIHFARLAGYKNAQGVDASLEQVELAAGLGINGVEQGDLVETLRATSSSSLDVLVAFDVIEHFERSELLNFVDEAWRVLAPGGRWIIHVPNAESPFFGRIRYGDLTHELAFTQASLAQLLMTSRFRRLTFSEDAPIPHGIKSLCRYVCWKLIRGALRIYLTVEAGSCPSDIIFTQNFLAVATK